MAGGGAAFSQTLQSQDETNMGSGEPVIRYGTGGRITGFDKGEIRDLARFGQNGDTILAHINPQEARMLKRMGGSGTINPITGLPQFDIGDDDYSSISLEGGGGGGGDYGGDFGGGDFGGDYGGDLGGGINDAAPYDPYTDEGPNQGGSPEVGIDSTLPDAGIVEIVDDRPSNFTPYDDDIPEIIIPDTRPPGEITPFDFGPDDILIPVTYEPDDIPEIIIPAPRPPGPEPTEITPLEFDPAPEPTWEFDPEPEPDIPEIIIPAPRPPGPEPVEITPFEFDPIPEPDPFEPVPVPAPVPVPVPEPEFDPAPQPEPAPDPSPDPAPEPFDPVPEPIFTPVPVPFYAPTPIFLPSPAPYYAPTPVTAPAPYTPPAARQGIYRSQYQNYANPLTMFNVSNYGQDVPTSPGYNYATAPGNMGINQLNQNLRDMANRQMAQTYPDGSPKGADMNQVLAEMRRVGLTATDLENAYYGRTTGLNTPFSVYSKTPPMQTPFSFTDVQQPQQVQAPQSVQQKQVAMSNGIFDLIKKLPT